METAETLSNLKEFRATSAKLSDKISERATDIEREIFETYITLPPDGGWGWVVVFGAFWGFLIGEGVLISFGLFLDALSTDLNCSKGGVALAGAIMMCSFCLSGPIVASLVNHFGYRIVGMSGSLVSNLAFVSTSYSESIYLVYFTYGIVGGIGLQMVFMPAVIAVSFYFERWRGLATGVSSCGSGLGGFIVPILATLSLEKLGWRITFRILSGSLLTYAGSAALFKPIPPMKVTKVKVHPRVSGNFFTTYSNKMYPTLSEITEVPTLTLLQPRKLNKSSDELMMISYPSSSIRSKVRDEETGEETETRIEDSTYSKYSQTGSEFSKTLSYLSYQKPFGKVLHRKRKIPLKDTKTFYGTRPMYRDDIFFNSSFNILKRYRKIERIEAKKTSTSVFSRSTNLEYHLSVTRVATQQDLEQAKCNLWSEAIKRTLATMLDYNLLKSPSFLLIASNAAFVSLGFFAPFMFIKDHAIQSGANPNVVFWLVSAIGIANTTGRVLCGILASMPNLNCAYLSFGSFLIGGIATFFLGHISGSVPLISFAVTYGFCVACISSLRTIITVDTLGLDKLTNSVGLILTFQGVSSLAGITISGLLRSISGNYIYTFYFSGVCIIIGAVFLLPLKHVSEWEKAKNIVEGGSVNESVES